MATQQQNSVRAVLQTGQHLVHFLDSLGKAEFASQVPGRADSVHEVAARLLVSQNALLASFGRPARSRPVSLPDLCSSSGTIAHRHDQLARDVAAHHSGHRLAGQFRRNCGALERWLEDPALPAVVNADGTAARAVDLLRAVGLDWVTWADDLTRACPDHEAVAISRDGIADAVRVLADVLRHRHPGRSIEVRIPPFAAVQCGAPGEPTHTRGTPPSVVECRPTHFLRLCRGREDWAHAIRHGHVRASGVRADLSDWLPLF